MNESIIWHDATKELPDSDSDVLILCDSCSTPVWIGHHDGERWDYADGGMLRHTIVSHWAELPPGPDSQEDGQ